MGKSRQQTAQGGVWYRKLFCLLNWA